MFCGKEKPPLDDFLDDFIQEFRGVQTDGIVFRDHVFTLDIHSLVCDAPARAYLKCVKGHSGYNGCERCEQRGSHVKGRTTFPGIDAPSRTGDSVADMRDEEHHHRLSPMLALPLDLVKNVPLDYMHLVCLGVTKLMIRLWMCGPLATRFSSSVALGISKKLSDVRRYIPKEFARKPRSIYEFRSWKATEYRLFLLFVGMVALNGHVPKEMYDLFLTLSSAMTILLDPVLSKKHASYAKKLLISFVTNFSQIFGSQFVV